MRKPPARKAAGMMMSCKSRMLSIIPLSLFQWAQFTSFARVNPKKSSAGSP
jgi:hypothetical protein